MRHNLRHIWYPCSQMKDYEALAPLKIKSAYGSEIELEGGQRIIDAISSWWCKSLGHAHPRVKDAILRQLHQFEHVMMVNITHPALEAFSEKLTQSTGALDKILFASDGSSAVEMALKMSLHSRKILGESRRTQFLSLANSYHGETTGALSVSDVGIYRDPYQAMLFDTFFISPVPYVSGCSDPLWDHCENQWHAVEKKIEPLAEKITAVIVEPIVQGAGNMKVYSQDFLRRLCCWAKKNNIHVIADEIMTGIGRAGKMFASEYADIEADFLCLSKGLTSGFLPMSVMLTHQTMYDLFYADYAEGRNFLHSHTQSGNALAISVALEVLNIIEEEQLCARAKQLEKIMLDALSDIADKTQLIRNVRGIGAIAAADLIVPSEHRRYGFEIYQKAFKYGALLRPIGHTIYWLPPLNIALGTLAELKEITEKTLRAVMMPCLS